MENKKKNIEDYVYIASASVPYSDGFGKHVVQVRILEDTRTREYIGFYINHNSIMKMIVENRSFDDLLKPESVLEAITLTSNEFVCSSIAGKIEALKNRRAPIEFS